MVRASVCLLFSSSILLATGCGDFRSRLPVPPVPEGRLRTVEPLELAPAPATVPATLPTTLPVAVPLAPPPREVRLSLADARARALANNLELTVARLDPAVAAAGLSAEEAAFEAAFTTEVQYFGIDAPSGQIDPTLGIEITQQSKTLAVTPGLRIPLLTGGTVTVELPVERQAVEGSRFGQQNNRTDYESDLTVSVTQPLLRGFGTAVSEQRIRVAFYRQQQAEARTKLEVVRVLAAVDRAYWRLSAARAALAVRVRELDLALAQLARAQRQVRAQLAAEVEELRAETGVADVREQILIAEQAVRDRQRELKRLMSDAALPVSADTILVPDTPTSVLAYDLPPDRLVAAAIAGRMELLEVELQLAEQAVNVAAARNDLLPLVSLQYTYNVNGLGDSLGDALDLTGELRFIDHRVGLQVEVPLGNRAARSRFRSAQLARLQLLATRRQRELEVEEEVLGAIDATQTALARVSAARQRVALNRRLLESEARLFEQGQRGSTEVLEARSALADAELALVEASAEYQIAQVDVAFATGTTLGAARVAVEPRLR